MFFLFATNNNNQERERVGRNAQKTHSITVDKTSWNEQKEAAEEEYRTSIEQMYLIRF